LNFLKIFETYSNIKFHEKFTQWEMLFYAGRWASYRDRHDKASSCLSQFCECPQKLDFKCYGMIVAKQHKYIDEEMMDYT
jgi:hypothetical protein